MNTKPMPVYLDNHSTTRVDPRVVEAMTPYWSENYGNAASRQHEFGWRAEAAVENARRQIASLVRASAEDLVFTSGATESINLALKGVVEGTAKTSGHIITAATEHRAVLDTVRRVEKYGFRVTVLPVDEYGIVDPDALDRAISPGTIIVSVMAANNEIGTIARLKEIGERCRKRGVLFHTDATQAAGKLPIDMESMCIDLLSMSAHKMHGPKGIGVLIASSEKGRIPIAGQMDGGGHERGLRSGTLNVPAIVGYGAAAAIAEKERETDNARMMELRDTLVRNLTAAMDDVILNGHPLHRLPNNANLTFGNAPADRVMMEMKDIAVSSGSACSSAQPEPSHVLRAIGRSIAEAKCSLRIGLSRFTTREEIEFAGERIVQAVRKVRTNQMAIVPVA